MPNDIGRLILTDLSKPKESGFSPFLEESYLSEKFYNSREEYKKISFGAFINHAQRMAAAALAAMPPDKKQEELARISRNAKKEKGPIPNESSPHHSRSTCSPVHHNNTGVQSLRDTIVAPYPNGDMAIVIFELDGDLEGSAVELEFSNNGQKIAIRSRVPEELTNAELLLGSTKNRKRIQDADCMLLNQMIKERIDGSEKDDYGNLWELREVIDLPFRCKKCLVTRDGEQMPSYLLKKNEQGYAWGYFWVIGEHVGRNDDSPTSIRCKATSDAESAGDDDFNEEFVDVRNSSQSPLSHNQYEEMSDNDGKTNKVGSLNNGSQSHLSDDRYEEMSIQDESTAIDGMAIRVRELEKQLEAKKVETLSLHSKIEEMQKSSKEKTGELVLQSDLIEQLQSKLVSKSLELAQLQVDFASEKEYRIHENRRCQNDQKENEELREKVRQLAEEQNKFQEIKIEYEKELGKHQERIHQLESRMHEEDHDKQNEKQQLCEKIWRLEQDLKEFSRQESKIQEFDLKEKQYEKVFMENQHQIRELESQINASNETNGTLMAQIQTQDRQIQEFRAVIDWKDDEYQKIQLRLQAEFDRLDSERQQQETIYMNQVTMQQGEIIALGNQNRVHLQKIEVLEKDIEHKSKIIHELKMHLDEQHNEQGLAKEGNPIVGGECGIHELGKKEDGWGVSPTAKHDGSSTEGTPDVEKDPKGLEKSSENEDSWGVGPIENHDAPTTEETPHHESTTANISSESKDHDRSTEQTLEGEIQEESKDDMSEFGFELRNLRKRVDVKKSRRLKEKRPAKKKGKFLNEWKAQIAEQQNQIQDPQTTTGSQPNCHDEKENNLTEKHALGSSPESQHEIQPLPQETSRKRKTSQPDLPNKKLRKSHRLEEKRLARNKEKID